MTSLDMSFFLTITKFIGQTSGGMAERYYVPRLGRLHGEAKTLEVIGRSSLIFLQVSLDAGKNALWWVARVFWVISPYIAIWCCWRIILIGWLMDLDPTTTFLVEPAWSFRSLKLSLHQDISSNSQTRTDTLHRYHFISLAIKVLSQLFGLVPSSVYLPPHLWRSLF